MATLKLLVQDPSGYFIPNTRRDNFVVYENGMRQQNVTAEIEHASVSLAVLLEFGGRARGFNRELNQEVTRAAEQFLDELGREDKIAMWKYSDKVEKLADFSQGHERLASLLLTLNTPEVSATNLYDATIFATEQMRTVAGRKAIILISSGIDTFSKADYQDVLQTVRDAGTPIYGLALSRVLREIADVEYRMGPVAKIDWTKVERELQEIATASGGRAYVPENTINLSPVYDDMMENLRVRYVITYRSSMDLDLNSPRSVRVALVNPRTGGPLQIIDTNGKTIAASVIVQETYIPGKASGP
jgi:Ca-activated chloride channel homolog